MSTIEKGVRAMLRGRKGKALANVIVCSRSSPTQSSVTRGMMRLHAQPRITD